MGLISKILDREPVIATVADSPPATPLADPPAMALGGIAPSPCPACGSPLFWLDVYGGGPHCRGCQPPAGPSLIEARLCVVGAPGDTAWEDEIDRGRDLGPPGRERSSDSAGSPRRFSGAYDGQKESFTIARFFKIHKLHMQTDHSHSDPSNWQDEPPDAGLIKTHCRVCNGLVGYRSVLGTKPKAVVAGATGKRPCGIF